MDSAHAVVCLRCGAANRSDPPHCRVCGAPLARPAIAPITVGRSERRRFRLKQTDIPTLPGSGIPLAGQVRSRTLSPPAHPAGCDYELESVIGEGGMGVVWSARQAGLRREVAIKRPRPGASAGSEAHLLAEADLAGRLEHPGIVPVIEAGIDHEGRPFYAMRRLRGGTWSDRWHRLDLDRHVEILVRLCDAVAYAHSRGVVHRDLKPGNVFLGDYGEVVLFDWGLAADLDTLHGGPARILASGTPAYMAPEMAIGDARGIGFASDQYLLGAILYEILTGDAPHPGDDADAMLDAAAANRIEPPLPAGELAEVAARAMATAPADRYPDVRAFQEALRESRSRRASDALAARAAERLVRAVNGGGHADFTRAITAYEDAISLWPGSVQARTGLASARLEHARHALGSGDLDLAGSLLDADDPRHGAERMRLQSLRMARARRRRLIAALGWSSALLVAVLVVVLAVGYLAVARQRDTIMRIAAERDAAESALAIEQAERQASGRRLWRRVLQEDFARPTLAAGLRPDGRQWRVDDGGLTSLADRSELRIEIQPSPALAFQLDVLPEAPATIEVGTTGAPLELSIGDELRLLRGGELIATGRPAPAMAGLMRRIRLVVEDGIALVQVDGAVAIGRVAVGARSDPDGRIRIICGRDGGIDNLKIDVPW
jgi:hypothetical protein